MANKKRLKLESILIYAAMLIHFFIVGLSFPDGDVGIIFFECERCFGNMLGVWKYKITAELLYV